jgi:hypothetical protein
MQPLRHLAVTVIQSADRAYRWHVAKLATVGHCGGGCAGQRTVDLFVSGWLWGAHPLNAWREPVRNLVCEAYMTNRSMYAKQQEADAAFAGDLAG